MSGNDASVPAPSSSPSVPGDGGYTVTRPARSVVIPCYNERHRLPPTLAAVQAYLPADERVAEIVLVDDGCTDGTFTWVAQQMKTDPRIRVVEYGENRGKGYAIRQGMLAAQGEAILFMDADGSTPIGESEKMWPLVESGNADIVLGSRHQLGSEIEVDQSTLRRWAGRLYARLTWCLLLYGVKDTQCGFKVYSREASQSVFSEMNTWSAIYDLDALVIATRKGYRIAEVPVVWKHDADSRLTYDARKSMAIFLELLRLKWKHRVLWPVRLQTVEV